MLSWVHNALLHGFNVLVADVDKYPSPHFLDTVRINPTSHVMGATGQAGKPNWGMTTKGAGILNCGAMIFRSTPQVSMEVSMEVGHGSEHGGEHGGGAWR